MVLYLEMDINTKNHLNLFLCLYTFVVFTLRGGSILKKTLSYIYRLCYIIFSLWGLIEYVSVRGGSFLEFIPLINIICLIVMLCVFILSLKGKIPRFLSNIKCICTLLALILPIMNTHIITAFFTKGWILAVLTPLMFLLDWLLFDKKGSFSLYDLLVWLLSVAGILLLLNWLLGDIPFLTDIINFLRNPKTLLPLIICLALAGILMYLIDALFSGKNLNLSSNMLRIIFIALEIYCFAEISNLSLGVFIKNLKYYSLFINFLCFLCVAIIFIRGLFVKSAKTSGLLIRIKGCLATSCALLPMFFGIYGGVIWDGKTICFSLCIVCPIIIIADCVLYDRHYSYKAFDPLIWTIIPALHFILTYFILRPLALLDTYSHIPYNGVSVFFCAIFMQVITGYILYFLTKLKKS